MDHLTLLNIALLLGAVATAATAQVLLRFGMRSAATGSGSLLLRAAASPAVLGGLAVFGVSAVLWLWTLSKLPLSVAYPFNGLSFIAILVSSHLLLGEHLRPWSVVGVLLVAAGVTCVALSA